MESISANLKSYWQRRNYQRISGSSSRPKNRVELNSSRRRRFWRIKITPKLQFFNVNSSKKWFIRVRDMYIDMMLRVASSTGLNSGFGGGSLGSGNKEYDEKMVIEIYKSRMAQSRGEMVVRGAGVVACR